jgi:hypothetical protein
MNMLTLVIYLADVIPNVSKIIGLLTVALTIVTCVWTVGVAVHNDCQYYKTEKAPYPPVTKLIVLCTILGLIFAIIPGRQTILLMAGSQFGEQVVTSPEAKQLFSDIQQVIHDQLDQYKTIKEVK